MSYACLGGNCGVCPQCKYMNSQPWVQKELKRFDRKLLIYTLFVALPISLFVTFIIWMVFK
jgi:hypothetical protein